MITQEQQKQGAELMNTLVQKAWEDASFKEQLIKNPISTLETITGQKIQNNLNVVVEDQSDESVAYFNIPAKPDLSNLALTEEQLEQVAGGVTPLAFFATVAAIDAIAAIGLGVGIYAAVK